MPAKKKAAKKKSSKKKHVALVVPSAPAAAVVGIAKSVGEQLIGATAAWTEIRRIAQGELDRLAGK